MTSDSGEKKKPKVGWLIILLVGIFTFIAIAIILLINLTQGETTTTGDFPDSESSDSITCDKTDFDQPLLDTSGTNKTTAHIAAMFSGNRLSTISVTYSLYYDDGSKLESAEDTNHAKLNLSSQGEGLGADIFDLNFSKADNRLDIRLFANARDINNISAKYLLLNELSGSNYNKTNIQSNYTNQGFKCVVNSK